MLLIANGMFKDLAWAAINKSFAPSIPPDFSKSALILRYSMGVLKSNFLATFLKFQSIQIYDKYDFSVLSH